MADNNNINPHTQAAGGEGDAKPPAGDGKGGGKPQAGSGQGDGDGGDGDGDPDPEGGDGDGDGSGDGKGKDGELSADAKAKIKKANNEAAQLRKRLKDAEAKVKGFEDASKSESDKAKDEAAQAKQTAEKLKGKLITKSIETAAIKLDAHDAETIARLIDRDALEFDDDGEPTNLDDLLDELKTSKPFLFGKTAKAPAAPKVNPGKPDSGNQNKGALTRDAIEKMTPDEINKNWDAIQALMKEGKLNKS